MVEITLAAIALLLLPTTPWRPRRRTALPRDGLRARIMAAAGVSGAGWLLSLPWWLIACAALAAAIVAGRLAGRGPPRTPDELRRVAATFDLIGACLDAGLAPAATLRICADLPGAPPVLVIEMRHIAAMLAVGGDDEIAWRTDHPQLAVLAAGARRSARGGVRLAEVSREIAGDLRADCRTAEAASAARAGIVMTAPLALCFLPAFLCLGLAPVVIGMVGTVQIW